ncbi:MAG: enoyl-CoA hydratase/isomerase family protein, partial [Sphingopyxis sp.]
MSELLIEARGGVEIATLNRPERLNALNEALVDELNAYFGGLAERPEVRVVILRGAGRGFCAGLDIREDRSSDETPV